MKKYLMIDIGGTNIKYGVTTDLTNVLDKGSIPTEANKGFDYVVSKLKQIIIQFGGIDLIAISQAGIVSSDSSIYFANPKMVGFNKRSFKVEIEKEFNIPTFVVNDAKAGAAFVSKNIPDSEALLAVLGTGVGVALIIDSKVFMASSGITGEIGLALSEGLPVDDILSLSRLNERIASKGNDTHFGRYKTDKKTDPDLIDYFNRLVQWTYNFFVIYGIPNIYFGGSLPHFGQELLTDLKEALIKKEPLLLENIKLSYAPSGEDANMLGALFVAFSKQENN